MKAGKESQLPSPPPGYEKRMPRHEEATRMVVVGQNVDGRDVFLTPEAAQAWRAMSHAAAADGVHLLLLSGFRSIARQTEIIRSKLATGLCLEAVLRVNAYPGHSEHHSGCAIDVGSPHCEHLSVEFERTPEFVWLETHASAFGFKLSYPRSNPHGIDFEPWHWRHRV